MELEDIIAMLQASVAPCVLISGVGLLLLSMTNRLGRPIDRIRALVHEVNAAPPPEAAFLRREIAILYRRATHLRRAIAMSTACALCVGLIILLLFAGHLLAAPILGAAIQALFVLSLVCLIASLFQLLLDIRLTLHSVRLEITAHLGLDPETSPQEDWEREPPPAGRG